MSLRSIVILSLLLVVPGLSQAARAAGALIGDPLPDLTLTAVDGGTRVKLRALGGVLAFTFFSRYCRPCREELPALHRAVARVNRGRPSTLRVKVLVLVLDDVPPALRRGMGGTLWLDDRQNTARDAFVPRQYPCTYLVKAGRIRQINRGYGRGYEKRVERWLRELVDSVARGPVPAQ